MYIDSHCHLFYPNFAEDIDDVIARAKAEDVDYILVPSTDLASAAATIDLTQKYNMVYGSVGVHPHDSSEWNSEFLDELERLIRQNHKIVAIGEIGLDYYYDYSPRAKQIPAFRDQIELAMKHDLPVIVHNREASEDVHNIIMEYVKQGLKVQMHCFSEDDDAALDYAEAGVYISFTGNVTFKKRDDIRNIAASVPLNNLLLETDAPFMTPEPHRGKRNEPAYAKLVAAKMAELHGITTEDFGRVTSYNAFKLFGIGAEPKTAYTYKIRDNLYINVTNRCNADCVFCRHKEDPVIMGHNLKMSKSEEPPAKTYIEEMDDPKNYDEVVFCGYGEPTIRWDVVKEIASHVKKHGGRTRLDTNGHGNIINKRDITPEMKSIIDRVSVSLNAASPEKYAEITRTSEKHFHEMVEFARSAAKYVDEVVMSAVGMEEVDIEKAAKFASEHGVKFRERAYK